MSKAIWEGAECYAVLAGKNDIRSVTKYVSPKLVFRLTRMCRADLRSKSATYVLTIGAPNYRERLFVKAAKRAGEPFPIAKVQLRHWPKKRK